MRFTLAASAMPRNSDSRFRFYAATAARTATVFSAIFVRRCLTISFLCRHGHAQASQSHRTCKQESFRRYLIALFFRCRWVFCIILLILRLHVQPIVIQDVCWCLRLVIIQLSLQVPVSLLSIIIVIIAVKLTTLQCSLK